MDKERLNEIRLSMRENPWPFLLGVFMVLLNVVMYLSIPETSSCTFTYLQEQVPVSTITGNCTYIQSLFDEQQHGIYDVDVDPGDYFPDPVTTTTLFHWKDLMACSSFNCTYGRDCRMPEISCEELTTQTTIPTRVNTIHAINYSMCPSCPDCVCTKTVCKKCPACDFELEPATKNELLELRPKRGQAPAFQTGYFRAKKEILELLELKNRSKFFEGPSTGFKHLYATGFGNDLICFPDESGGEKMSFHLNNTIWMISGEGSYRLIHKR